MTTPNDSQLPYLRSMIDHADHCYHNGLENSIADEQYDEWKATLRQLAPDDIRLARVGAVIPSDTHLAKASHTFVMGSLNNAMTPKEFDAWANAIGDQEVAVTPKFDGMSLALYYEQGVLTKAITRGDGDVGEDITYNAVRFQGVRIVLEHSFTGAVRGEVVLTMDEWKQIDPEQESNPRNLAAGIARRKNGTDAHRLSFFVFDIIGSDADTYAAQMQTVEDLGLQTAILDIMSPTEVHAYHERFRDLRSHLPFWVDGIVVRVNKVLVYSDLGVSNKRPKGAIAYKFLAEQTVSTLEAVEWTVGHSGKVSPVAKITPVQIGGVTVSSALLCNMEEIRRLDLHIGDQVTVARMGDVIPKILGVAKAVQLPIRTPVPIIPPNEIDGHPVAIRKNTDGSDTVDLYVSADHPAVSRGKIMNWIKKLDIQGIGDEVLNALMDADSPVKSIVGLYRLREWNDLHELPVNGKKFGKKRAQKILNEIDKTRTLSISDFLGSLGVRHLGRRRVELILEAWDNHPQNDAELFNRITSWFTQNMEELGTDTPLITHANALGIPGIAGEIQAGLDDNAELVEKLLEHITIQPPKAKMVISDDIASLPDADMRFKGVTFCFTGFRPTPHERELLSMAGGAEKAGVSSGLDYLVAKDPASGSSKVRKAQEQGVNVISYAEFQDMLAPLQVAD